MDPKYKRIRLWVDPPFQSRLLLRMVVYLLLLCAVMMHVAFVFHALMLFATSGLDGEIDTLYLNFLYQQQPLFLTMLLFAPVLLYDFLKFSHRVAGPLFRCRKIMDEMSEGKPVRPFTPRRGDLMRERIQAFNTLIEKWNARVAADAPATEKAPHSRTSPTRPSTKSPPRSASRSSP